MNILYSIKELYNLYLEEKETPQIMEVKDNKLDFDLDNEDGPADPYLEL